MRDKTASPFHPQPYKAAAKDWGEAAEARPAGVGSPDQVAPPDSSTWTGTDGQPSPDGINENR